MADVVLDLMDRRPVWAIPAWAVSEIRAALPDGWTLHSANSVADGSGDGQRVPPDPQVLDAVRGARAYIGYGVAPQILEAGAGSLEWVHTGSSGVGSSLHDTMRNSGVRFTNSAGIHGPPIAETVLAMLLYFFRGLDLAAAAQHRGAWDPEPFYRVDTPVREMSGATVGIVGYGGIGREVGERLRMLGARVLGLRRSAPRGPDSPGVEILHGVGEEGLGALLDRSDAVVITAPETAETRGLISRERLGRLRPGAVIVNVARGSIVDEEALLEGLRSGRIRGAGLDVFQSEPLPAGSPLWTCRGTLITPHVSGVSHGFWRREVDLILENLHRWQNGDRLQNEVDFDLGY